MQSIVESLRRLAAGETLMDTQEVLQLIRAAADERGRIARGRALTARLTPREREELQSLADGLSNKEIARRLHISVETQRTHMVNILAKLEAHSQLQALVVAVRFGIVDVHEPLLPTREANIPPEQDRPGFQALPHWVGKFEEKGLRAAHHRCQRATVVP